MQSISAQPYSKRPVPTDLTQLSAWLTIELGNIQRGMIQPASKTISTNYTATTSDGLLLVDTTAGAISVTLPDPNRVHDMVVTIKRISAGAHNVTIVGTVDGTVNPSLTAQWKALTVWAHVPSPGSGAWYEIASV